MGAALRTYLTTGIAIVGSGLIAVGPAEPLPAPPPARQVMLAGIDSPLGSGTALIPGASFVATPSQGWLDAFAELYLAPRGFTGSTQAVTTPESLYPFTGPFSMTFDNSTAQGVQIMVDAITAQIAAGGVSADNPVVVGGYSQSSTLDSLLMSQLAGNGIDPEEVHFVLLGDPSNPNGGMLERFALPEGSNPVATTLGLTFSGATPSDVSPTDIYTYEYDGFAHFPQYPINFLADINAYLGIIFNHSAYLGLTPEQIADAIALPTSTEDGLTNYFMIESASLPLLAPLRLLPFLGNPLADLLQPALSVLINLGYGSVTDSWSGYADVPTPMGFLPDQSVLDQVPDALLNGLQQGVQDAFKTLMDPTNYQLISPETMDYVLGPIINSAIAAFNLDGSQEDISNYLSTFLNGAANWFTEGFQELSLGHTGLPPVDMAGALLFTLPPLAVELFNTEMAAGNPLDAIGEPLAALVGLAPLMLIGALL
ncbi:PE-PPE domain-containing protein [Mycolicibacter heraklionensis]|uniref:PE-PPE domain-containing protein n=1 Tax=Mycolicibacter heraklionensis TaxID=512402 RepID=A0A9X7WEY2_9MYCO|nr:PE-PPE domain-containing protein [Mycolicibacter heraklionensis]QZA06938.1 PE-PPE domain-containing protein [Mycolicibacter heraklionensis]